MASFAIGACSSMTGAPPRTFSICAPVTIGAPGATADQLAAVDQAIALWSAVGVTTLARAADPDITVLFEGSAPADYGLFDGALVYINDELDPARAAIVLAHELGHAFGLVHTTARASVMNPGNLSIAPTADDRAAIAPCD